MGGKTKEKTEELENREIYRRNKLKKNKTKLNWKE
jgi:hypothetical protein